MTETNKLYTADNLSVMRGMNSESVDLIYLDPPFNSKRIYAAPIGSKAAGASFKDMWTWKDDVDELLLDYMLDKYPNLINYIRIIGGVSGEAMMSYCLYMAQRVIEMHRVLKSTGSLYLHCDPTASHYLKILLDSVFGNNGFKNEVVWSYRRWTAGSKNFQRMHDIIFRYTKTNDFCFNVLYEPYGDWIKSDYKYVDEKTGKRWRWHTVKGKRYKVFLEDEERGVKLNDVWSIPYLGSTAKERTKYPTQKPLALIRRIVEASSNSGDMVLDPFCGCATTCVAAQQLQRKWIGIDVERKVADLLVERLQDDSGIFRDFIHINALKDEKKLPKRTDIVEIEPSQTIKERLHKEQESKCNGCRTEFDIHNLEIDHIIPKSKGGGDYVENYQLLCGNCNRMKGNRPMEYLLQKIRQREKLLKSKFSF